MRLGRIATPEGVVFARITEDPSSTETVIAHQITSPFSHHCHDTGRSWSLSQVELLAPVQASKVVCIGKNYTDHIIEMGGKPTKHDPIIFLKPNTAIIGPYTPIQLPPNSINVHYEGELAVVIDKTCKDISAQDAYDYILGYTIANDVSERDQQRHDGQWTRAKSYDTFCPLGPWIMTDLDPRDLRICTRVNGIVKQDSRTSLLIHSIGDILAWISAVMTLLPGDVILTGTPAGVGPLFPGDRVEISIDGIGTLTNPVIRKGQS